MNNKKEFFGARELVAIGIGGMIGGGIFSVLGLAVDMSGHAASVAFLIAGVIALFSSYSYVKLALAFHSDGASFTYLEHAFPALPNLAGILGWIIIVGYLGTLSLYAYTFGVYASDLIGLPRVKLAHGILSSVILFLFMWINLLGVRKTGLSEDFVVYSKMVILFILAFVGFVSVKSGNYVPYFNKGVYSVFPAAAIIFVAYEGFQLITNAVCETEHPRKTIPKSIYTSVILVTAVYFLLSLMSIGNMTLVEFKKYGEYALAVAVSPVMGVYGRVLVDIAAIFATSSAINATLFGASRMAVEIANEKMLPKAFSFHNKIEVPWFSLVVITVISLVFAFLAPLEMIATFASLTFLIVSIGVVAANIKLHKITRCNLWVSFLSLLLMLYTAVMLVRHLVLFEFNTFLLVIITYAVVVILELLVSQRKVVFH